MPTVAFPIISGICLALLLLPASWHIKARNSGTLIFIFWAFIGNLVFLVNSVVWNGNIRDPAPVWCDISTKLIIGLNVALPCASLCIQRRLYMITRVAQVGSTPSQKRRDMYIDLSIGLGFPLLMMALHYVVQANRYNIIEDYGCWPVTYPSWPAYTLVLPWPWIISSVSIVYSLLTIKAFLLRRATFNELLRSQSSALSVNRYIRLMALASIEVLFVLPMALVIFVRNVKKSPPQPWHSWEYVHADWYRITYITRFALNLDKSAATLMEITRWCMPFSAILFFIFFGMASEARKQYRIWWYAALKPFGVQPPLSYTDKKDTPLTATTLRTARGSFNRKNSVSTAVGSPIETKGRPDTFAWLEEGLPYDDLPYDQIKMPQSPATAYSAKDGYGHTPNTPSTSTSHSSTDGVSTLGRHASISTTHTGKTLRFSVDDDATICGVPTSLKRADSIDKSLPEIPFEDFTYFRQSQIAARQSAAESVIDPQVQIVVSSPTATEFTMHEEEERNDSTPTRTPTPTPATTSLAPPVDSRPLSIAQSVVSQDGGETVFFTPSPGRLSLFPVEYEVTPEGTRVVYINEEGQRVSYIDPSAASSAL